MSRYIDADALMDALNVFKDRKNGNEHFMYGIETAKELLGIQPTVDAVPVEQIEAFIDWLERNGYTLLKKAIINALHDYRADGERRSDGEQ